MKAELECLRLDVQNMQLQLQCVHQEMQQLKEVVLAAIRPKNGEDALYQGSNEYQTTDLSERRNKINIVKVDEDHGRRCDLERQTSPQHAEDTITNSRENEDSEALSFRVIDSIQKQALLELGDDQNEELWEAEELSNEQRGARQLEAIMRSMGMIMPSDRTSDVDSDSDTCTATNSDTNPESDVVTHNKEVEGSTFQSATNERHKLDGVGNKNVPGEEKSVCESSKREEEVRGTGAGTFIETTILDRLDAPRKRNGFVERVQEMQKCDDLESKEELETMRGEGMARRGESEVEVRGWEGGEGDAGIEDVMRRLAVVSARRDGETPNFEYGGFGTNGEGRGVAERLVVLAKRGVLK